MKSYQIYLILFLIFLFLFSIISAVPAGTYIYHDKNGKVVMELPREPVKKDIGTGSGQPVNTGPAGSGYPHKNKKPGKQK